MQTVVRELLKISCINLERIGNVVDTNSYDRTTVTGEVEITATPDVFELGSC